MSQPSTIQAELIKPRGDGKDWARVAAPRFRFFPAPSNAGHSRRVLGLFPGLPMGVVW